MRNWPDPQGFENWQDWAARVVQDLAAKEQEESQSINVGQIGEFVSLPPGWLECDGSSFDGVAFPALKRFLGGTTLPTLTPQYSVSYVVGIKT